MWHDVKKIAIEDLKSIKNAKVVRILQGYITSASLATWRALGEAPILLVQERVRKRIGVPAISPAEKRGRKSEDISLEMKTKVCETISREFNLEGKTFDETDALSVAIAGLWGP
jgi:hypothetical protein